MVSTFIFILFSQFSFLWHQNSVNSLSSMFSSIQKSLDTILITPLVVFIAIVVTIIAFLIFPIIIFYQRSVMSEKKSEFQICNKNRSLPLNGLIGVDDIIIVRHGSPTWMCICAGEIGGKEVRNRSGMGKEKMEGKVVRKEVGKEVGKEVRKAVGEEVEQEVDTKDETRVLCDVHGKGLLQDKACTQFSKPLGSLRNLQSCLGLVHPLAHLLAEDFNGEASDTCSPIHGTSHPPVELEGIPSSLSTPYSIASPRFCGSAIGSALPRKISQVTSPPFPIEFSKLSSEFASLPRLPSFPNQQHTSEFPTYASLLLSSVPCPELENQTPVTRSVKTRRGHQAGRRFQAQCNLKKAKEIVELCFRLYPFPS